MEQRHSKLGIASFTLSILAGILIFILLIAAGVMEGSAEGGIDEESTEAILMGLAILGLLFMSFVAFLLGIIALFQKEVKKLFAILGAIFSALTLGGTIILIIIGMTMG